MNVVLDASALLAWLRGEPGADRVRDILRRSDAALLSAVNLTEILQHPDGDLTPLIAGTNPVVAVRPYDHDQAAEAAALYGTTRAAGLGIADRACLALARVSNLPAVTADRAWSGLDVGVDVVQIR